MSERRQGQTESEGANRLALTAFLLRPSLPPLSVLTPNFQALAEPYVWRDGDVQRLGNDRGDRRLRASDTVLLVTLAKSIGPPGWQHFIEEAFGISGFVAPVGRSMGAIVFCAVTDPTDQNRRWVAWTFGSGSRALRKDVIDPRFGLVTALNRIVGGSGEQELNVRRLRQFYYQQFGAYRQRTSHRAARDTPLEGFRFDQHTDLLAGAGGPRADAAGYVYGSRQIKLRDAPGDPSDLARLAQQAIDDYRRNNYEESFSFIDDYVLVEDDILITRLRTELFADLRAGNDNVDAFVPDDLVEVEDERAIHYILFPGEQARQATRINLTLRGVSAKVQDADESALDWSLRFCDSDKVVVADATVLECLSGDLTVDNDRYLVSDGSFFLVRKEFIEAVDGQLESVPMTDLDLPCYGAKTEGEWNMRVAAERPDQFVCTDGALVKLDGETPFEAADLIHVSGALIHAKRKSRSSSLSYLFLQASRACRLLSQVPTACEKVRTLAGAAAQSEALAEQFRDALQALDARPPDLEVVLAILGDWRDRGLTNLPLIAKLALAESITEIGLYGFRPTIALIDLCRDEL